MTVCRHSLEERHGALRLTPDEWMQPLFGVGDVDRKRAVIEHDLLWSVAARALELGLSVVLDYGLWSREERAMYRARGHALGANVQLHVLDLPLDELWARLERRNANLPPRSFVVSRAELELWDSWFQRPGPDELTAEQAVGRAAELAAPLG